MELETNKVYECSNGDRVTIYSETTDPDWSKVYFGVRMLEQHLPSIEKYKSNGTHFWNCDLDIITDVIDATPGDSWYNIP